MLIHIHLASPYKITTLFSLHNPTQQQRSPIVRRGHRPLALEARLARVRDLDPNLSFGWRVC